MKVVTAIVLMCSLCFQSFIQLELLAWYKLNKNYIAKKYCVNKNKPAMKCCGKCYLQKQLNTVTGSDRSQNKSTLTDESSLFPVFIIGDVIVYKVPNVTLLKIFNPARSSNYMFCLMNSLLKPPRQFNE
ncbi:MAG: hypothetical protein JSS82_10290 [Bacteroidetes bacterium]|nr:hypothetical protein [Bacteroidota bacterium]